jgi:hypothetical protein
MGRTNNQQGGLRLCRYTRERHILLKAVERLIKSKDLILEMHPADCDKNFGTIVASTVWSVNEEKERDKVERMERVEVAWRAEMEREASIKAEKK